MHPSAEHPEAASPRTAIRRVLVIVGHPRAPSFNASLGEAYAEGARAAGMEVRLLNLARLHFDPDVRTPSPLAQPLEPDLEEARASIAWADHLAIVFPSWWGIGPARLHGFLDRVLLPGFAFGEHEGRYEGLLTGRSAHLITTIDMPPWVYRLIYRSPGTGAMRRSILGFCGIETLQSLALGPVKDADAATRANWLETARRLGYSLQHGGRSRAGMVRTRTWAWLQALRLQFYPMTWMAYTIGALAAAPGGLARWTYWIGYLYLFFLEAATVFANDVFDYPSDRRNRHYGPFNGGSRVLIARRLSMPALRRGIVLFLVAALACAGLLLDAGARGPSVAAMAAMLVLALGYTAPPLRLCWRGLGEIDVGLTHSLGVMLCGYLLQDGAWRDAFPWLASLPLFLAILPSIMLAGFPDLEADRAAGKRTLAVRLGHRGILRLALLPTVLAPAAAWLVKDAPALRGCYDGLLPFALAHAALLCALLWRKRPPGRIDGLLICALTSILWYVAVPLWHLSG
ncbi:NAD(P)H-dependent oxidoreductase [Noviherbaspirillum pedocola]|uniref:NAD(P)H-dependent oxidoreductase n=1 Tax=Noviherbaspirillum pedocola TaxID=2801341 RepID=A0A934SYN2_9BURK|nr:NAD(P)H-dependent oxidoreductase [Noviherbaspirillum pedocola]MBK4738018.1 NAD(P)H-dependent oxidoreductase [Noviherbaspirillum pedocola]